MQIELKSKNIETKQQQRNNNHNNISNICIICYHFPNTNINGQSNIKLWKYIAAWLKITMNAVTNAARCYFQMIELRTKNTKLLRTINKHSRHQTKNIFESPSTKNTWPYARSYLYNARSFYLSSHTPENENTYKNLPKQYKYRSDRKQKYNSAFLSDYHMSSIPTTNHDHHR